MYICRFELHYKKINPSLDMETSVCLTITKQYIILQVLDYLAIGVHELANMSERRTERLVNPGTNYCLFLFLIHDFLYRRFIEKKLMSCYIYTCTCCIHVNKVNLHFSVQWACCFPNAGRGTEFWIHDSPLHSGCSG